MSFSLILMWQRMKSTNKNLLKICTKNKVLVLQFMWRHPCFLQHLKWDVCWLGTTVWLINWLTDWLTDRPTDRAYAILQQWYLFIDSIFRSTTNPVFEWMVDNDVSSCIVCVVWYESIRTNWWISVLFWINLATYKSAWYYLLSWSNLLKCNQKCN